MFGFDPKLAKKLTKKYADGGPVRGPGTGTSDDVPDEVPNGTFIMPADSTAEIGEEVLEGMGASGMPDKNKKVPVQLSNGEYKLTPEQVYAVGLQTLHQMKDATHTPVKGGLPSREEVAAWKAKQAADAPKLGFLPRGSYQSSAPAAPRLGFLPRNVDKAQAKTEAGEREMLADGGPVFGGRGLQGLRDMIPRVEALGFPQAPPAPAPATAQTPAGSRNVADLKAMIPQMAAMGYRQTLADGGQVAAPAPDAEFRGLPSREQYEAWKAKKEADAPRLGFLPRGSYKSSDHVRLGFADGGTATTDRERDMINRVNSVPMPGVAKLPTPPAPSPTEQSGWRTNSVLNGAAEGAQTAWDKGQYGKAAGIITSGAAAAVPAAIVDVADDVGSFVTPAAKAVASGAKGFWDGMTGNDGTTATATAAPQTSAPATPPATPPAVPTPAPAPVQPSAQTPSLESLPGSKQDATEVRPGIFRNGNSFSDGAAGASGQASTGGVSTGGVSPQNMAAADNLVTRGFPSRDALAAMQTREQSPVVRSSATDWQARKDLANAETSAKSITNTTRWGGRGAENSPSVQAYNAMLSSDLAARNGQATADVATMQQNAGLDREGMQQAGANQRDSVRAGIDRQRVGVEQQRVGLDGRRVAVAENTAGYQLRAADQMEKLRGVLVDPKASEADRANAQKSLLAISGHGGNQTQRFTVVPGGQEIDPATNMLRKVPDRVLNNQTGQFVDAPAQGGGGIEANPKAVAIRDNTSMTKEQKIEALRKLGYS